MLFSLTVSGQSWIPGYEFRKKITFHKSVFVGPVTTIAHDVLDFPILIEFQDDAFKYRTTSIAFATLAAPTVPLNFQIESYDPVTGSYSVWVRLPTLAVAATTTPGTVIYFYYGGTVPYDNFSSHSLATWNSEYAAVWHLSGETASLGSQNMKTGTTPTELVGKNLNSSQKLPGKIGSSISLDGQTSYFNAARIPDPLFTFSTWVKWRGGTGLQTIATSDSILNNSRTGWYLKVSAAGMLEAATYRSAANNLIVSSNKSISVGQWFHVSLIYAFSNGIASLTLTLDGIPIGVSSSSNPKFTAGGSISIGRNKDGAQYFNGDLDEIRLFNATKPISWIKNEYVNQNSPSSCYIIGAEEYSNEWSTFTATVNSDWSLAANWLNNQTPGAGSKVRIASVKAARITSSVPEIGVLRKEPSASLSSAANVTLTASVYLGQYSKLSTDPDTKLILNGTGSVIYGAGMVEAADLEINTSNPSSEILFEAEVTLTGRLILSSGTLNANGKLTLLSSLHTDAAVSPLAETANIKGEVNVERYISGDFPSPSTARGWRLLSSPVYQNQTSGGYSYRLEAIQEDIFVTGANEVTNGFDPSPLHGATIYTHDQSRNGTLAQKYLAIPNMSATIPVGRGFFVFSRGSRHIPAAYERQIRDTPFISPGPYKLKYTGQLFTGSLSVPCFNKASGAEGDGFNLIGNPYASPVQWGLVQKENLREMIWLFDPLNNGYYATANPTTVIGSGVGFFVRVKEGAALGSITFSEGAKFNNENSLASYSKRSVVNDNPVLQPANFNLKILLRRNDFAQPLELYFTEYGRDQLTDADGLKVGDGLVSIGSVVDGVRLSIDERCSGDSLRDINLYVKGYESGNYAMQITGLNNLPANKRLNIRDRYLDKLIALKEKDTIHQFYIDQKIPGSYGAERFTLTFTSIENPMDHTDVAKKTWSFYPNPVGDQLHLSLPQNINQGKVTLRDLYGKKVLTQLISTTIAGDVVIDVSMLSSGPYLMEIVDGTKRLGKTVKLLKQ